MSNCPPVRWPGPFPLLAFAAVAQILKEAQDRSTARQRQRENDWRNDPGVYAGQAPAKHRNVQPQDARSGNLVMLDCRKADEPEDLILGEWERTYSLALVCNSHHKVPVQDRQLDVWLCQPHLLEKDASGEWKTGIPLWLAVADAKANNKPAPKTDWPSVVQLPWCAIKELPLSVYKALQENPDQWEPHSRSLLKDFEGTKELAYKMPGRVNQGFYKQSRPVVNVSYVCQLDKGERKLKKFLLNEATQMDILSYMHAREHDPDL